MCRHSLFLFLAHLFNLCVQNVLYWNNMYWHMYKCTCFGIMCQLYFVNVKCPNKQRITEQNWSLISCSTKTHNKSSFTYFNYQTKKEHKHYASSKRNSWLNWGMNAKWFYQLLYSISLRTLSLTNPLKWHRKSKQVM